jgi:tetratricopeptide (TPR) repeat protein
VAGVTVVSAGVVAGIVLASGSPSQPRLQCRTAPPAVVVPGVATTAAGAVRDALGVWPHGTLARFQLLVRDHPKDPVVQFNYGTALLCAGYLADAEAALRAAKTAGRDTWYEIDADKLLHPQFFQGDGYPLFEPTGSDPLLVQGVVAQRSGHQHTAERLYAKAARLHPNDPDAQVAAAVGRFDEDKLALSFSKLGPLVKRFPRAQTVWYHLGLLLAWTGQRDQAVVEFRLAVGLGASTRLGKESAVFLKGLAVRGTEGSAK